MDSCNFKTIEYCLVKKIYHYISFTGSGAEQSRADIFCFIFRAFFAPQLIYTCTHHGKWKNYFTERVVLSDYFYYKNKGKQR